MTSSSAPAPLDEERRLVVLQSIRALRATTNPYLVQLVAAIEPWADVATFSWRRALLGRWDVLHVHWPEVVARRQGRAGRLRTAVGYVLLAAVLLRVRLTRRALVRTLHNVAPHEAGGRLERAVLAACDRTTTLWVLLNDVVPPPVAGPTELVPHGDYVAWFRGRAVPPTVPGRLALCGQVRPYKGVEDLLAAFARTSRDGLTLHVVGRPSDERIGAEVRAAAGADPRVTAVLRHADDDELAREVGEAALVVLPYRSMENSGMALLALSLGRPVLLPDHALARSLAAEVGPGWVQTFAGPLTPDALEAALAAVATAPAAPPDLTRRTWSEQAAGHRRAYRRAVALARGDRAADSSADRAADGTR